MNLEKSLDIEKENIRSNDKSFFENAFGKAINNGINYGLKKILPDFIENDVIEIKDQILSNGIREGINLAIEKASDVVSGIKGIFTGKFEKTAQIKKVIDEDGILDQITDLLNKGIGKVKESEIVSTNTLNILKGSMNVMNKSLNNSLEEVLTQQNKFLKEINNGIANWQESYKNEDFLSMEKEYQMISKQIENKILIDEIKNEINSLKNIHELIKSRGGEFNLSNEELELAEKLL